MRTLVIDTATEALSVALIEGQQVVAHHHDIVGRGHAERLIPAIAALPNQGRADEILVDVGPGSFTGVRIGLAAARAFALAWNVPVRGYSTLPSIAVAAHAGHSAQTPLFVAVTGGHGELFWQRFAIGEEVTPIGTVMSTPIAELAQAIDDPLIFGSGACALVEARGHGTAIPMHPDSINATLLPPSLRALPAVPIYGRGADAKVMA